MGKNKDKKKKGSGMEKTLAKTEKKIQKNIKKELDEIGEVYSNTKPIHLRFHVTFKLFLK